MRWGGVALPHAIVGSLGYVGTAPQMIPLRSKRSNGSVSQAPRNSLGGLPAGATLESTVACLLVKGEWQWPSAM
jgi:hypothetical protein